jgi:hypothetical protein
VIPLYPQYAIDEAGAIINISSHRMVIPWMNPEDEDQPYVTLPVSNGLGQIVQDNVSLDVILKLAFPESTGIRIPPKTKITIEIEDPEKALRILDRLYPRDWGIQDISNYEVYGWMRNVTEQIQNAMKEGSPNDGRQQGLASNT